MRALLSSIVLLLVFSSCLKKLEEVDTANDNIYDHQFAGDIWFELDTVYIFTNQFNNQVANLEFHIKEEYTPELTPTNIDMSAKVNNGEEMFIEVPLNYYGVYKYDLAIPPDGSSAYCLELGVLVLEENDTLVINSFSACKDL